MSETMPRGESPGLPYTYKAKFEKLPTNSFETCRVKPPPVPHLSRAIFMPTWIYWTRKHKGVENNEDRMRIGYLRRPGRLTHSPRLAVENM